MTSLPIESVRIDGGTQMRAVLDEAVVADYAATIRGGVDFPPVTLFFDGSAYWLGDGFHRYHAYRAAGATTIEADVRAGTKRDAILFSVGANTNHGLRRTNEDKRKAVLTLLSDDEWCAWSDREIARRVGVGHPLVADVRAGLSGIPSRSGASPIIEGHDERPRTVQRNGTTYQQKTANIGKAKADKQADRGAKATEQAEHDRQREEHRAALPAFVAERQAVKDAAIAARAGDEAARPDDAHLSDGLSPEDRIAELEEAVSALEGENAELRAENKLFDEMKAEWAVGGFEAVIAGKDEVIRTQLTRIESESREKVANLRSADFWRKEALKLGYSRNVAIDIETGEIVNG